MYIVTAHVTDRDGNDVSIYVSQVNHPRHFTMRQRDAARYETKDEAIVAPGFRIVRLVSRS